MTKTYAVLVNCGARMVPDAAIRAVLDGAKDWCRFGPSIWFISTNLDAGTWFSRVRAVIHPEDNIIVCGADMIDMQGWASNPVIEWHNRDHDGRPGH